ncbi:proteasome subunit alpha type-3 [Zeugodacus cucurbitae]|uniref:Proteasome subunit alpha type-3 n=1 Tax=Zeugodacus cucurbitae TaxID=28588 RepID=A0A0A1XI86_ZEUCU|nr:proteasome subunit alpha type-3 [Zeugodacus cucurbitae]
MSTEVYYKQCAPSIGFDENGKIDDVEEAKALVAKSTAAIGILCKDGVVLAVENSVRNPLHIKKPLSRIFKVDNSIGMVVVGNLPDGRALLDKAKENARNYYQSRKQHISLEELIENLGEYLHNYTNNAFVRPFGVSVILCGWNKDNGYQLYKLEPCGDFYSYFACVAGKSEHIMFENEMQDFDPETMVVSSAVIKAKEMIKKQSRDYPFYRSMELCILGEGNLEIMSEQF